MICRRELADEHAELATLAGRLIAAVEARDFAAPDLPAVRQRLSDVLTSHLAKEDGYVYPLLIASNVPRTRWVATRFSAEMGGLARTFGAYVRRWTAAQIETDPEGYRGETIAVLGALCARIRREDGELYPMLGPMHGPMLGAA